MKALEVNTIKGSVVLGSMLLCNKFEAAQIVVRDTDTTVETGDKLNLLLIGSNLEPGWLCLDKDGVKALLTFLYESRFLEAEEEEEQNG